MKFYTAFDKPEKVLEINSGEFKLEDEIFEDTETKLLNYLNAGLKTEDAKRKQFDKNKDVQDMYLPMSRMRNVGLEDMVIETVRVRDRFKESIEKRRKAAEEEAKKEREEMEMWKKEKAEKEKESSAPKVE